MEPEMPSDGGSFLPRIQSVFYAVFDVEKGPMIVYQVPEGFIGVTTAGPSNFPSPRMSSDSDLPSTSSRSVSLVTPSREQRTSRSVSSPQKTPIESSNILFNFDDISNYIIPRSALCGRLVICATTKHKIIGFPVELKGDYKRNYFKYNLCFVFERSADLSCYEPIVRKVSRVLSCCEEESRFLSSPTTSSAVHAILEQLYEDLNSYSETHIPIDEFNSIDLKIFPFYPNPPAVKDWMVPLALINLTNKMQPNWDLTLAKICPFIDGVNHVSRIAHIAECDLELTRQAISHLLYYQVIMTIDIFQYSNMYTLTKSIQWLADEAHVREECGLYVRKPGRDIPDWSRLLHLYSRLKPGTTVFEWMHDYNVHEMGLDVRRFTSFGVIKGFLRRVRRWPVLLPEHRFPVPASNATGLQRSKSNASYTSPTAPVEIPSSQNYRSYRGRLPSTDASIPKDAPLPPQRMRRSSGPEPTSFQLRSGSVQKSTIVPPRVDRARDEPTPSGMSTRRSSLVSPPANFSTFSSQSFQSGSKVSNPTIPNTPRTARLSRSPSQQTILLATTTGLAQPYPSDLLSLLDGKHHADELSTKYEVGWPKLEQWLVAAGGGKGDGDFGRVCIIYR